MPDGMAREGMLGYLLPGRSAAVEIYKWLGNQFEDCILISFRLPPLRTPQVVCPCGGNACATLKLGTGLAWTTHSVALLTISGLPSIHPRRGPRSDWRSP